MIADFHTHTFPEKIAARAVASLKAKSHTAAFSDGTAGGLLATQGAAGIGLSVVLPVATTPEQPYHINDRAAEQNDRMRTWEEGLPAGILSFGAIHPAMDDAAAELRRIRRLGLRGIKIHPVYQGYEIDDPAYLRILDVCAQLGLIVVTHAGLDIGFPGEEQSLPGKIRRAVRSVDPEGKTLKLVAAHMGGWMAWDEVPEALADTGVYLDTSFSTGAFVPGDDGYYEGKDTSMLDAEGFLTICRAFGPERLLFGTDSPWSNAKESLAFLKALPLAEAELAQILSGNALRLLS
ncbi:MAG: amidohydrolase family protein [Clostridia bacterium]|nr:amidohydrolase family protein [Clostridia bacterium]